jgi:hypothetical protein
VGAIIACLFIVAGVRWISDGAKGDKITWGILATSWLYWPLVWICAVFYVMWAMMHYSK